MKDGMKRAEFGNLRRNLLLGGMAGAAALLLIAGNEVMACGSWGSIDTTSDTDSMPDPTDAAGAGVFNYWEYSMSGADGEFEGFAYTSSGFQGLWKATTDTGVQTATGWQQKRQSAWTSDPSPHHGAPDDALITGQGDGTCQGTINMNANNWDIDSGSCAALGYAQVIFSGVKEGTVEINLNGTFSEGASQIAGTLSATPSLTITTSVASDIADAQGVQSISVSDQIEGNIAGQLQKGYGTCSVRARTNTGAISASGEASTALTVTLTRDFGGNGGPCGDSHTSHSH